MRQAGLAVIALILAACSGKAPTVIDGSTPEAFEQTTAAARRDLPDADRLAFDAALKRVPGSRYGDDEAEMEGLAREAYNGMTAREVVDMQETVQP